LSYKIGDCHRRLKEYQAARRYYRQAVDFNEGDNFGRATTMQNGLVRKLAAEYGIPLVDAVRIFEAHSPHGLVGNSLFVDGHHPNLQGQMLLADAFARALATTYRGPPKERIAHPGGAFQAEACGRDEELDALFDGGRWLFSVSARHAYPGKRLGMAERQFVRAINLDPENFSAWLGLGLTRAAMREGFMSDKGNLAWLGENRFFYGTTYRVSERALPEVLRKLKYSGVPETILKRIVRAWRRARSPKGSA